MEEKIQSIIIKKSGKTSVVIPKNIIEILNNYIDQTIEDEKKINKLNAGENLVGDVTQEFMLDSKFIKKSGWYTFLASCVNKWIEFETKKKITRFEIKNSWVVRQFENEYNPIHYHEGDLSGVGYLKLPKGMTNNKMVKNKKLKTNGTIDFINGQKGFLSKSIHNVVPKIKDLLIFPNYLMHTAYPFNIDGERRSFSFNAKIILKNLNE